VYNTTHEETFLMPAYIKGIRKADFKIAIDDNWAAAANMIRKLGMHSLEPVDVKGVKVRPIDVVVSQMPRPVELAGKVRGHAGVVVEVIGRKKCKRTMVKTWTTMSHEKAWEICRSNATGYLVGAGGAVGAEMVLSGDVKGSGMFVPEQLPAEKFVKRLPSKHLEVKQETTPL
jgi:saccharopine dehydrogenase-like NADP-dependent oxidoreductase